MTRDRLTITQIDAEVTEVYLNNQLVQTLYHDEIGWRGMNAVTVALTKVATILNLIVETD